MMISVTLDLTCKMTIIAIVRKAVIYGSAYAMLSAWSYIIMSKHDIVCPVLTLTGLRCPGCGGIRAVNHLSSLNVIDAIQENLYVFICPLVILITIFLNEMKSQRYDLLILFSALAWMIIRNVYGI